MHRTEQEIPGPAGEGGGRAQSLAEQVGTEATASQETQRRWRRRNTAGLRARIPGSILSPGNSLEMQIVEHAPPSPGDAKF